MSTMRRIMGDRLTGGLLAAVVTYVTLLQGLVSAFAQGALAAPQPGASFVICSQTGAAPGTEGTTDDPLERAAHYFCAALCQAAASHGPILPTADLGPAFEPQIEAQSDFPAPQKQLRPSASGLSPEARGPPSFSI